MDLYLILLKHTIIYKINGEKSIRHIQWLTRVYDRIRIYCLLYLYLRLKKCIIDVCFKDFSSWSFASLIRFLMWISLIGSHSGFAWKNFSASSSPAMASLADGVFSTITGISSSSSSSSSSCDVNASRLSDSVTGTSCLMHWAMHSQPLVQSQLSEPLISADSKSSPQREYIMTHVFDALSMFVWYRV